VGTDPGPQKQARSSSPAKSISTSSSSLGVCERIAFFDCGASPVPGGLSLVHGARSGSPTGTPPQQQLQELLGYQPYPGYVQRIPRHSAQSNQKADFSMSEGAKASGMPAQVLLREVVGVMADMGVVVAAMDMSANMNARRLLEGSLHLVRGVDPEAKEAVETVMLTSNARIWDQVPVPKRFVFISYLFLEIYLTFLYSLFELVPCGIFTFILAMSDSAGSSAKLFSSGPSYRAYLGQSRRRKGYYRPRFAQLPRSPERAFAQPCFCLGRYRKRCGKSSGARRRWRSWGYRRTLPFPDDVRRQCRKIRGGESKRKDEVDRSNLVSLFSLRFKFDLLIKNLGTL
jgi:hypothetical protein